MMTRSVLAACGVLAALGAAGERLPVAFADRIAYAQFLHDGSEVKVLKGELEIPVEKPPVEIPVVEVFLK